MILFFIRFVSVTVISASSATSKIQCIPSMRAFINANLALPAFTDLALLACEVDVHVVIELMRKRLWRLAKLTMKPVDAEVSEYF